MAPIRLCSVSGHEGRINDILFCPATISQGDAPTNTVVYFGGDVQDFPEVMETHRDNRNYLKWNLENVATLISNYFPKSHTVVIRPSRMEFKTFSCYDNFVPSSNGGVPDHTPTHYALQHLERLLQGVTHRIKSMHESELIDMMCSSFGTPETEIDVDILQVAMDNTVTVHQKFSHSRISNSILQKHLESGGIANAETHTDISEPRYDLTQMPNDGILTGQDGFLSDEFSSCPSGVIQIPNTTQPSVLVSNQCQSAIVANPQSNNITKNSNTIPDTLWWREALSLDKAPLTLIGFSKGCVVLNQLIYEFHYMKTLTPDDGTMMRFVSRITDMYWLDGGHAGGKNTWITSRSLLETLTRLNIKVHIHVTPYQVCDDRRPWIRREERQFCDLLQRLGAEPKRILHFAQTNTHGHQQPPATLHTHFEVLSMFIQPGESEH